MAEDTAMPRAEIDTRLADLRRKLKARENLEGYRENVEAIKRALATLEAEMKTADGAG